MSRGQMSEGEGARKVRGRQIKCPERGFRMADVIESFQ